MVKMCTFGLSSVAVGSNVCRLCGLTSELETIC
jgi:hypothetical protein